MDQETRKEIEKLEKQYKKLFKEYDKLKNENNNYIFIIKNKYRNFIKCRLAMEKINNLGYASYLNELYENYKFLSNIYQILLSQR